MKNKRFAIIAAFVVFAAIVTYMVLTPSISTQTAVSGKMEDSSKHRAIVIRNESIVRSDAGEASTMMDGVLQTHVSDGEYVKRFKNVATVYKSDDSADTEQIGKKLANVTDRINQITSSESFQDIFDGDDAKIDAKMKSYVKELISSINLKSAREASDIKTKMDIANDKRAEASMGRSKLISELAKLNEQKEQYEKSLANLKTELYSSLSGIFSSSMDGYEEILTANSITNMTVSDFDSVFKEEKRPITGCKIIDNYEWYTAIETDSKRAENFSEGEIVYLRFDTISKDFEGIITHISKKKNGKNIITVTSSNYDVDITPLRKTEITLIKNIYSGLKIPSEAIKTVDGKEGVYAVKGKILRFIETEILYNDGKNAIVKEDNLLSGGLLLYDEVVVSGRNIYDGKSVK